MKLISTFLFFGCLCFYTVNAQQHDKDAVANFELFYNTFKDNYAFFSLKGVDWDGQYASYRAKVSSKTTEKQLVALFSNMVKPLNDGHVMILKGEEILFHSKSPSYFKQEFKGVVPEFWKMVDRTLQNHQFSTPKGIGSLYHKAHLFTASRNENVGYLRISRCYDSIESVFNEDKEASDTALMLRLLDSLLPTFNNTKGLIIDLRANGGGHAGFEMASRFAKIKTLTHYKSVRQKGAYDHFSEPEPIYIVPDSNVQYLKPIVILINDRTASSAEDFTLSLYRQDNVTVIGMHSAGMFSDMLATDLPNGLSFTLSNQSYLSADKSLLEGAGIPVDFEIKNTRADITNQSDPAIIKAIELLQQ